MTAGAPVPGPAASRRERVAWLGAVAVLAVIVGALALRPPPMVHPAKLALDLTTPPVVDPQDLASFALSPDGTQVVATGVVDGRSQLLLRGLDSATSRPVPGTVGGMYPFWSPDGRSARLLPRRLSPASGLRRGTGPAAGEGHRRRRRLVERRRRDPVCADPGQSDFPHIVGRRDAGGGHCLRGRTCRARIPALPARWPPLPLLRRRQPGRPRRLRRSARRIGRPGDCSMPMRRPSTRRGICSSSATARSTPSRSTRRSSTCAAARRRWPTASWAIPATTSPSRPAAGPSRSAPAWAGGSGSSSVSTAPAARSNGSANPMTATPSARRRRPVANASPSSGVARPIRTSGCSTPGAGC